MLKPKPSLGLLADLLDGLDIGLCAFDADDRTLAWNQTFLYLFPSMTGSCMPASITARTCGASIAPA